MRTTRAATLAQHAVADVMTVLIVDSLEVVDIEQNQGEGTIVAASALELEIQQLFAATTVADAGKRVSLRLILLPECVNPPPECDERHKERHDAGPNQPLQYMPFGMLLVEGEQQWWRGDSVVRSPESGRQ